MNRSVLSPFLRPAACVLRCDMSTDSSKNQVTVGLALLSVYIIWGSTYLASELGLNGGYPPLMMGGSRFVIAGILLVGLVAFHYSRHEQWFLIYLVFLERFGFCQLVL